MPQNDSRELYLRLLHHVRPYWRQFGFSMLGLVVVAATEPAMPALFKPMLDGEFLADNSKGMIWVPMAVVGLFVVRGIASYIGEVAMNWVGGKVVLDLRDAMFNRLLNLPSRFYDENSAGIVISKVTYDVQQVTKAATKVLTVLVRDSLSIVGLVALMLYLNWTLALVALVVVPLVSVIVTLVNRRLRTLSRSLQERYGDMTHILEEAVTGQKVVKVFGGKEYERQRFNRAANWVRRFQFKSRSVASASVPVIQVITALGLAVIIYMASRQVAAGTLTVGGFVAFFGAMGLLFSPIKRLTGVAEPLQKGLAAAESVFRLMDQPEELDSGTREIKRAGGDLRFEDVTYIFPGAQRPALKDIDLRIDAGETVALVGPSGSGKSTLANLIPRFYCLEQGRILLDGIDVATITMANLRANISYVSQDVVLFNDTVAANIAYGTNCCAPESEILEAARLAHALEFIQELPEGLRTNIGDRGVRLSGGQRQRLAIARALLKDAPIVILDEATSALDNESERYVQEGLETLRHGRTTLVIAHRLSTIENADRIVVLRAGRIVESGTHQQLLTGGGLYSELYRARFVETPTEPAVNP